MPWDVWFSLGDALCHWIPPWSLLVAWSCDKHAPSNLKFHWSALMAINEPCGPPSYHKYHNTLWKSRIKCHYSIKWSSLGHPNSGAPYYTLLLVNVIAWAGCVPLHACTWKKRWCMCWGIIPTRICMWIMCSRQFLADCEWAILDYKLFQIGHMVEIIASWNLDHCP